MPYISTSRPALSEVLPPLILGTATFNTQYNPDPSQIPYSSIVHRALATHGIAAFDTSPYYGPSEVLLGNALESLDDDVAPRDSYMIITKAGRIGPDIFDYSPAGIAASVRRSLTRLRTSHLDLVYAHDAEFVTPAETLAAVRELRRLRDEEGLIRYVGVSGYPVDVLADLAEMILRETGEPLDAVLSYNHFCVQNTKLGQPGLLQRFQDAGVCCLLNASMLGMGLITTRGVDAGPMVNWHPAPSELRSRCHNLASIAEAEGEHLEEVAIRWSLGNWARLGAPFGTSRFDRKTQAGWPEDSEGSKTKMGVSVMGVSTVAELDETYNVWRSVVDASGDEAHVQKQDKVVRLVEDSMWPSLGEWKDYSWHSGKSKVERLAATLEMEAAKKKTTAKVVPAGLQKLEAAPALVDR